MTLVIRNSAVPPTITVSHNPDGSIQLYHGSGLTIPADDAVKLAEYILASQPAPVESEDPASDEQDASYVDPVFGETSGTPGNPVATS